MAMQKVVQDSSGIVGLFNVEQAAQNIYLAMHAIQHRGQDGVGVAVSNGENVVCKKGLGLLSENLKQDTLNSLDGDIAIGQLRMATRWLWVRSSYRKQRRGLYRESSADISQENH